MPLIVNFTDSFTSSSAPVITGGSQEDYTILNNQSSFVSFTSPFTIDSADSASAFVNYELERIDASDEYRQSGTFIISFDGTDWVLNLGNYQGSDLIQDNILNPELIQLQITTTAGVGELEYKSGNMASHVSSKIKMDITRIVT